MGQIHVTNPGFVIIVSGTLTSRKKKRFAVGGWACVCPCVSNVQKISLELMTLSPFCEDVETSLGVPVTVTAVAQCKIVKDTELLKLACEQFLGYDIDEIKFAINSTLEGHLRAILGTLTVEEIYKDREKFAALVREVASPDVGKMGVEIISFTIKDITDNVGYLSSLGKTQTAIVKRDANIGVAEAERDAGIKEAEAEKMAMDYKYMAQSLIGKNTNTYKMNLSNFEKEVQTRKAEVALAYDIQASILSQEIKEANVKVDIMERKKMTEVEGHEVTRKNLELTASVRLPAEAEAFRLQTISEGNKIQVISEAKGIAEKIKKIGAAEAYCIEAIGKADAFRMSDRALIFKKYSSAAKLALVLNNLPNITSHVSSPLAKINEILVLGESDDLIQSFNKLFGKIPPSIKTIAGVDVTDVLKSRLAATKNQPLENVDATK